MLSEASIALVAVGAATAGVFTRAVFMPRSQLCGPVVYRGDRDGPARAALTFDDGPDPESTPKVLDVLAELGVQAAFFLVGKKVEASTEIVRRMHGDGHVVGNHSYTHPHLGTMRRGRFWMNELSRTDDAIERIIGRRPALFRPPMGFKTFHVTGAAAATGHTTVTWTRRAFDGLFPITQEKIVRRLQHAVVPGDIVMMHDGLSGRRGGNQRATADAIAPLISAWRERGLALARLDDLIHVPPYQT